VKVEARAVMDRTMCQSRGGADRPLSDDPEVDRPAASTVPLERATADQGVPDRARQEWARQELALPSRRIPECEMPERVIGQALQPVRVADVPVSGRVAIDTVPAERAMQLAESILALVEPWRARFLELITCYVGTEPGSPEVALDRLAGWLTDADLHDRISRMLRAWNAPK